jgi:hypothetical protein
MYRMLKVRKSKLSQNSLHLVNAAAFLANVPLCQKVRRMAGWPSAKISKTARREWLGILSLSAGASHHRKL